MCYDQMDDDDYYLLIWKNYDTCVNPTLNSLKQHEPN